MSKLDLAISDRNLKAGLQALDKGEVEFSRWLDQMYPGTKEMREAHKRAGASTDPGLAMQLYPDHPAASQIRFEQMLRQHKAHQDSSPEASKAS